MCFRMKTKFSRAAIPPGRQIHGLQVHPLIFRRCCALKPADLRVIAQRAEQNRGPTAMKSAHKDKTMLRDVVRFHGIQAEAIGSLTKRSRRIRLSLSSHHKTPR